MSNAKASIEMKSETKGSVPDKVTPDYRMRYLMVGFAALALLGSAAWLQPHRLNPFASPDVLSFEWFASPVETNAHRRVHLVEGNFNAVALTLDGSNAFAVGNGGLILESKNGGRTWQQKNIKLSDDDLDLLNKRLVPQVSAPVNIPKTPPKFQLVNLERSQVEKFTTDISKPYSNRINYANDASQLSPSAERTVRRWANWLQRNPAMAVTLEGHADTTGTQEYSLRRAESMANRVKLYLVSQDIDPSRLSVISYGEERPLVIGTHQKVNAQNRRVVIRVTGEFRVAEASAQQQAPQALPIPRPVPLTTKAALEQINFHAVKFLADRRIFIGGTGGTILSSKDDGETWQLGVGVALEDATVWNFTAFFDNRLGAEVFAAVSGGKPFAVYLTGGQKWQADSTLGIGKIKGSRRFQLSSAWITKYRNKEPPPNKLFFGGLGEVLVLSASGELNFSDGVGARKGAMAFGLTDFLASNNFRRILTVSEDRGIGILRLDLTGRKTVSREVTLLEDRSKVSKLSRLAGNIDETVWAVGNSGAVIRSSDGGENWKGVSIPRVEDLRDIAFANDNRSGLAVGNNGVIARSEDGGSSWGIVAISPQTLAKDKTVWDFKAEHMSFPAPWFLIGLFLPGFFFYQASRPLPPKPVASTEQSISEIYASDQPIQSPSEDSLNFYDLATGSAAFLNNTNTEPPLTMAVTGKWGSGKSSLMSLICHDMADKNNSIVWFNAWHHQQENNLLAALLSTIRREVVVPIWKPEGMIYRSRLFWARIKHQHFKLALLLAILVVNIALLPTWDWKTLPIIGTEIRELLTPKVVLSNQETTERTKKEIDRKIGNYDVSVKIVSEKIEDLTVDKHSILYRFLEGVIALGSVLFAVSVFLSNARAGLGAVGLDPGVLLGGSGGRIRTADLRAQVSFRHRFAKEFRRTTEALGRRKVVLVIDDLDRCQPEHVVEILEAVNFLVSSGQLYVLLGMDKEWVELCIAKNYMEIAEVASIGDSSKSAALKSSGIYVVGAKSSNKSDKTTLFARKYLEKLVNIDVPVPESEVSRGKNLTSDEPVKESNQVEIEQKRSDKEIRRRNSNVYAIAFWVCFVVSVFAGTRLFMASTENPSATGATHSTETGTVIGGPKPESSISRPPSLSPLGSTLVERSKPGALISGGNTSHSKGLLFIAMLILMSVFLFLTWFNNRNQEDEDKDSADFNRAMNVWGPFILAKDFTPRSVKRFVNRVRYLAMLRRYDPRGQDISEEELIFAAAIHHCRGDDTHELEEKMKWPEDLTGQLRFVYGAGRASEIQGKTLNDLAENLEQYASQLKAWVPDPDRITLFKRWARNITVH